MKKRIEEAIKTTLVVENKGSIKYAVEKIHQEILRDLKHKASGIKTMGTKEEQDSFYRGVETAIKVLEDE